MIARCKNLLPSETSFAMSRHLSCRTAAWSFAAVIVNLYLPSSPKEPLLCFKTASMPQTRRTLVCAGREIAKRRRVVTWLVLLAWLFFVFEKEQTEAPIEDEEVFAFMLVRFASVFHVICLRIFVPCIVFFYSYATFTLFFSKTSGAVYDVFKKLFPLLFNDVSATLSSVAITGICCDGFFTSSKTVP